MRRFCFASFFDLARRCIPLCVLSGTLIGCFAADRADLFYCAWMRAAICGRVSIVGLACVALFPLYISAFAVAVQNDLLLCAVCVLRSSTLGFCTVLVYRCFRMRYGCAPFLLLFTAFASFVVLCRFWLYATRDTLAAHLHACSFADALIVCADLYLIAPRLTSFM